MSFEVVRDVDGLSDREINDLLLVDDTPDHRTSVSRTKSVISGLGGTSMNSANSSLGDDAKWRFLGVSQRRAWKMRIRIASHPVPLATRALASLLAVTVAISWVVTSGLFAADDPPRFDRGKTKEAVRAILAKHVGQVWTGLWMGGQLGDALYEKGSGETLPTASAIKTAILIELFARFAEAQDRPLIRSTLRRTKQLTGNALTTKAICELVKRRLKDAGLPLRLSPHSFRVATITDLLTQGVPLEDVQYLAGHAEPRTTGLYDRRQKKVTRNIVERISI